MLWIKAHHNKLLDKFIDLIFRNFWKRELDLENHAVIISVIEELEIKNNNFVEWKNSNGRKELNNIINNAHKYGVFGVPSYLYKEELFWGREQLPMIEARITDRYRNIY